MSVVSRWRVILVKRKAVLALAKRRVAYWENRHPKTAAARAHVRAMLTKRRGELARAAVAVAAARRVIARHNTQGVSSNGVNLIKSFEGFSDTQYRDSVGVLTIGYGTTEADIRPLPAHLTERQAARLLQRKLDEKYLPAVLAVGVPLTQNQVDALVSLAYNCGPGVVAASTQIGRALRAKDYRAAADHILDWDHAGGRRLAGLTRRRRAERALFLKP